MQKVYDSKPVHTGNRLLETALSLATSSGAARAALRYPKAALAVGLAAGAVALLRGIRAAKKSSPAKALLTRNISAGENRLKGPADENSDAGSANRVTKPS